jgi:plastocyanin/mono/diheme cytochrome c family protein
VGAVQKLATVVIIGLVALATVLVVYLADEPTRRESEAADQAHLSIERGTQLYITYCLQCHGPNGLGAAGGEDPPRVGGILNQEPFPGQDFQAVYQSDNPAERAAAEAFIRYRIQYGYPENPNEPVKAMPAFGQELNVEEVNDLVYLIMNGDWDYVYNQSVLATGASVAQAECDATPPSETAEENAEQCERVEDPEPVYPTVPATPVPEEDETSAASGAEGDAGSASGGQVLEALDPYDWSQTELTLAPGDTIQVVNAGLSQHDFTVDELGISQDLTDEPVEVTIPADAAPGTYEFYCSVPGHAQGGMVGTLTIEGGS